MLAQTIVWLQVNSQFVWPESKKYNFFIALIGGTIISYLFIYSVRYIVEGFDGQVWPGRLIPTATGMIIFSIMTWLLLKQGIDLKTGICLALAVIILIIQLFWR
jgi:hypothetical protein